MFQNFTLKNKLIWKMKQIINMTLQFSITHSDKIWNKCWLVGQKFCFLVFFFFRPRENKLHIVGPLYLYTTWQAFIFNFQDTCIFIYNNDQTHSFIKYKLRPDKRARLSNKKMVYVYISHYNGVLTPLNQWWKNL